MSPNEAQLRAALHDGEGDSPDASAVISRALRVRRDRRRRVNAMAGGAVAAAVVGLGVTGLVALAEHGGAGGSASSAKRADSAAAGTVNGEPSGTGGTVGADGAAAAPQPASPQPVSGQPVSGQPASGQPASGQPTSGQPVSGQPTSGQPASGRRASSTVPARVATALPCPATAQRFLLPGGGGSGQFGSTGALFTGDVAAMRVCAYPLRTSAGTRSIVVSGPEARKLATSLDAAPATGSPSADCGAQGVRFAGATVEMLPVGGRGAALKPVVITLGCPASRATNGTAVRYVDEVPARVTDLLSTNETKSPSRQGSSGP